MQKVLQQNEKRRTLICISLNNKKITKQYICLCLVLLNSELIFRISAPHSFEQWCLFDKPLDALKPPILPYKFIHEQVSPTA